ncbi:hemerythrin domain-containing protein [Nocardia transvalensis]|uniref:hemerythrin domain-containing protein n=1 Tax=Nocardia transvalensis TaxID=37333 RepID=UPI0018949D10|nr:hemerythrin domain-containing protein [Nocardia transvalensis]MBF6330920.1 hemerythrin domain-containing protein [Nocardia transvalensis]
MATTTQPTLDLTMMYAAHDAFRRDVRRMSSTTDPAVLCDRWRTFSEYLTVHHTAEDEVLWPVLRAKVIDGAELELLDAMEEEHAALDPIMTAITEAVGAQRLSEAHALLKDLEPVLCAHLDHEERAALPLIEQVLTPDEWATFGKAQRRQVGAATFLPWLLDAAAEPRRHAVLGVLPPPVRLLYRLVWNPRYQRRTARR